MRRLLPAVAVAMVACAPDAPRARPDPECAAAVEAARLIDVRLNRIDADQHALMLEWMRRLQQPMRGDAGARPAARR
jgi:hypothetical protein